MRIYESSATLEQFRQAPWEFQQTFQIPLKDLERFVDVIMEAIPEANGATAVLDEIVFEPRYELFSFYAKYSLPQKWSGHDVTIEAQSAAEAKELLSAVLDEWVDVLFVPIPGPFVIYADHDEYITFLGHERLQLGACVDALTAAKFLTVDYVRKV
jgi:hypothetical protein